MRQALLLVWLLQVGGVSLLAVLLAWPLPVYAQSGGATSLAFDLTANGVIDGADAVLMAGTWADLAAARGCGWGSRADLNGDGCVDVADVLLVAAAVGVAAVPAVPDAAVAQSEAAVWTVRSSDDEPDSNPGDGVCATASGACTLRAALAEANRSARPDRIEFNIRKAGGACPDSVLIAPDTATHGMLILDDSRGFGTVLDGYTQCGAQPNSGLVHGNAVIKIELYGRLERGRHGLQLLSPNNVVRGLALYNWDRQIEIFGARAHHNRVEGNFIGTNGAQRFNSPNLGTHHSEGLRIQVGAAYNIVGCGAFDAENRFLPCDAAAAAAARNIVIGNGNDGVHLERGAVYNRIVGNYVGLKQDGVTALGNKADGVDIEQGPQFNWLGGTTAAERNVVSGNISEGLEVSHGTTTKFNQIVGNYFGLDATGTRAVANRGNGVSFEDTVDQNDAYANVVSGNNQSGFRFYVLATRNQVRRNLIGVAADGTTPLPNKQHGVYVMGGSQHNLVAENLIAHHPEHGIFLASTSDKDNNYIGETYFNTLSQNQIFLNQGLGIAFYGRNNLIPNQNLAPPTLLQANPQRATGQACPGCLVELFLADKATLSSADADTSGEGMRFIGAARADAAGVFLASISEGALGQILTGTATDGNGNTSPFARNIAVTDTVIAEPTPDQTPTDPASPGPTNTPTSTAPGPTNTPTAGPGAAPGYGVWLPLIAK